MDTIKNTALAILWIHTNADSGVPCGIHVCEWNGRVDVLEQLQDWHKFDELDLSGLKYEIWIAVRVDYEWEDSDYSIKLSQIPTSSKFPRLLVCTQEPERTP